jgi:hypothetical protein
MDAKQFDNVHGLLMRNKNLVYKKLNEDSKFRWFIRGVYAPRENIDELGNIWRKLQEYVNSAVDSAKNKYGRECYPPSYNRPIDRTDSIDEIGVYMESVIYAGFLC